MKKLSLKQTISVASMLFGMFFGAGNLIFPVHLGQLAGAHMWGAALGFIVTGVGIPILAVAAIGNTHSSGLQDLSSRLGKGYGLVFTCVLMLTIGPFFAIPRCATVSYTTGVEALLGENINGTLALLIFTLCFFALVLYFSLKPGKILTIIGKIINPLFLFFLAVLLITALVQPSVAVSAVSPDATYESGAFFNGFLEGYNTMDAIAGLAFGIVVIEVIRSLGIDDNSAVAANTLRSGLFAGLLMALIYLLTILVGAQSRGLFELSENGGIALAQIARHYLGGLGSLVLALTITIACLKTSIALVTSCSETFSRMFPGRLSYRTWAIIFSTFSFAVSNVGLNTIITWTVPVLMLLYPLTISLVALALTGRLFDHDRRVYLCVTVGAFIAAVFDFLNALPVEAVWIDAPVRLASRILPFFDFGLGWICPCLLGLLVGLLLRAIGKKTNRVI